VALAADRAPATLALASVCAPSDSALIPPQANGATVSNVSTANGSEQMRVRDARDLVVVDKATSSRLPSKRRAALCS
jgi:hypothetical protein